MRKKISIIIFIFLLFTSTSVFAGDIPESIMAGKQKALFIGRITAINTDTYSIIPSTIMMGSIQQSEIKIKKFDKYYGTDNKPKTGNLIVAVLLDDNKIDDLWVFKCTSQDYKTLKLDSEKYDMVVRYQQYINQGKYFQAQKKIDESKKVSINPTDISVESKETVQNNKVQSYLSNNQFVVILLLVGTVIVAFFIVRFKKRHNN
ncbi:hypothetical protein [Clostridium tagluense]|uniref:hypothetical protein n=1 Tax=Clostridium tagluense TaxID=360422 RepID=UPI001C6EA561|nr:hypothetical protein [Clostridium tagluense]MBW9158947.1 hypothetical protein [Clostridium tagluense]WLC68332.1 hypothetical protein KTC93_24615 [Clostridium tagluense]